MKTRCTATRCKNNINGICEVTTIAMINDFDEMTAETCGRYNPKPPKKFSITLDEDQITSLLTLLQPSSDEGDPGEELYGKLYRYSNNNPIAANMYFINLYSTQQAYGGPEEGGWWYTVINCETSVGYDCYSAWNDQTDFTNLVVELHKLMTEWLDEEVDMPTDEQIDEALKLNDYCYINCGPSSYTDSDLFIAIERQPGAQHNTDRQYYC